MAQGLGIVNAHLVAGAIAAELNAAKLILLTDVEGVKDAQGELLSSIPLDSIESMIREGVIQGGMIPKLRCCAAAIKGGVNKAHIIDGRKEHAILLEIFTHKGIGSEITV